MTLLLATSPSQKVFGWFGGYGLKGTVGYLTANGLSLPIAYAVCFFEFFAGLELMFGLLTRPSALAVIIVMVGAIRDGIHDHHSSTARWPSS
jgi:putative oxidoreductase